MKNTLLLAVLGFGILAGGWWYLTQMDTEVVRTVQEEIQQQPVPGGHEESPGEPVSAYQGASMGSENEIEFQCTSGTSMIAVFTRDILALTLSDGRQITLRQAVSGSGIRYLNNTETIEFRSKGNEAYLSENGTETYTGCVAGN